MLFLSLQGQKQRQGPHSHPKGRWWHQGHVYLLKLYKNFKHYRLLVLLIPASTVHQVLQFFSFPLRATGTLQFAFRFPGMPFCYVTPSFHPSSFPSWVLLRSWMYCQETQKTGPGRKNKDKTAAMCSACFPQPTHPWPSCFRSVSILLFSFFRYQLRPTFHFCHPPWPLLPQYSHQHSAVQRHTHVLYLAMTMYSSASVQSHLKYNAHITWDSHREGWARAYMQPCTITQSARRHTDRVESKPDGWRGGGAVNDSSTTSKNTVVL